MKKRYLVAGVLALSISAQAQRLDSSYTKKKISHTEIQSLMAFYTQDGNHSAVTGGKGTENLQVYSIQASATITKDSVRSIFIGGGADVISSASTDRIDYVLSSASKRDTHAYGKVEYDKLLPVKGLTLGINGNYSFESDYQSWGLGAHIDYQSPDQMTQVSLGVQNYFDDLRWYDHGKHDKLVYPVELRDTAWFDSFRRNSYNVTLSINRVINERTTVGFYPGISLQKGILSTPFHRVYFNNSTERVERLPSSRLKVPVGVGLNTFIGGGWILRTLYRYYWDDLGIHAHSLEIESPVKLNARWTLTPFLRLYTQTAAKAFKPYAQHDPDESFYTSDYDLSAFKSLKTGLGARYAPFAIHNHRTFKAIELRYAFYTRSDALAAHVVTLFVDLDYR